MADGHLPAKTDLSGARPAQAAPRARTSAGDRLWGAISLIHPFPAATVVLTSGVLLIVAERHVPPAGFLLRAVAAVAMTQIAIGALNDYLDRDSDALGQPWKPIPSGRAAPTTAVVLVALGLVGCVLLGISFGPTSLLLLLLATAGGLAYDVWLKPTPFSIVGYLVGFLTLVTWIWFIAGRLVPLFAAVYPLGAIAVLTAHLAQALPDIDSDGARGQRGPAVIMGAAVTRRVVRLGLACMIAGALMLAVVSRDVPAIALTLAGFAAAAAALLSRDSGPESRRDEFRRVAAAVAMLAIGALTSLQSLIR